MGLKDSLEVKFIPTPHGKLPHMITRYYPPPRWRPGDVVDRTLRFVNAGRDELGAKYACWPV